MSDDYEVAPGLRKYVKASPMPVDDKHILGRNTANNESPAETNVSGTAASSSTVKEGDTHNEHGGKTWKPKTEKERDELSDKLADKATNILAGIKMPF